MKKANGIRGLIAFLMMGLLIVGYFYYLNNRTNKQTEEKKISEVQDALLRDIETDYPPSPKEVVKYYAELTKCFYEVEHSDDEMKQLGLRARELYDDELKASQTEEDYLSDLKYDIDDYKSKDMKISSYSTSASTDVEYSTTKQGEMASLYCIFTVRKGSEMDIANQKFLLRKDQDGHWKILGWTAVEGNQNESAE